MIQNSDGGIQDLSKGLGIWLGLSIESLPGLVFLNLTKTQFSLVKTGENRNNYLPESL